MSHSDSKRLVMPAPGKSEKRLQPANHMDEQSRRREKDDGHDDIAEQFDWSREEGEHGRIIAAHEKRP
jgi:hypothetical protein